VLPAALGAACLAAGWLGNCGVSNTGLIHGVAVVGWVDNVKMTNRETWDYWIIKDRCGGWEGLHPCALLSAGEADVAVRAPASASQQDLMHTLYSPIAALPTNRQCQLGAPSTAAAVVAIAVAARRRRRCCCCVIHS
jgi:hypothetical protein